MLMVLFNIIIIIYFFFLPYGNQLVINIIRHDRYKIEWHFGMLMRHNAFEKSYKSNL